jgi:hypothetical protein
MPQPREQLYEAQAHTIIKGLQKRNMEGYYVRTKEEIVPFLSKIIEEGSTVSFGGTMSLEECDAKQALRERTDITLLERTPEMTAEEIDDIYHKAFFADYYLMSTNAITLDGELLNIDGRGNRVAALVYGPKYVIVVAGMNKVTSTLDDAIHRAHNIASPANCLRLSRKTPCSITGKCADCHGEDCICSQIVYTRHSGVPGRIKVLLVGEPLGY